MKKEELESFMRREAAYAIKTLVALSKSEEDPSGTCVYCAAMHRKTIYLMLYCMSRFGNEPESLVKHMNQLERSLTMDVLNGKYDEIECNIDVSSFL